ncbi:MAG: hypothetical protein V4675_12440 [Verrucomicrobiota bacterium]
MVVQASPWPKDNQRVLDLAAGENSILGFVINRDPPDVLLRMPQKRGLAAKQRGLFSDHQFHNNGLVQAAADRGRFRVTLSWPDRGKIATPSLRDVAMTARN